MFTIYDDHYHINSKNAWFLLNEHGSATFVARSSICTYKGEPNDLKNIFKADYVKAFNDYVTKMLLTYIVTPYHIQ